MGDGVGWAVCHAVRLPLGVGPEEQASGRAARPHRIWVDLQELTYTAGFRSSGAFSSDDGETTGHRVDSENMMVACSYGTQVEEAIRVQSHAMGTTERFSCPGSTGLLSVGDIGNKGSDPFVVPAGSSDEAGAVVNGKFMDHMTASAVTEVRGGRRSGD